MGIQSFWNECMRVLRITKKPNKLEWSTVVKVAGLGILLIGLVGFIISMISYAIQQMGL